MTKEEGWALKQIGPKVGWLGFWFGGSWPIEKTRKWLDLKARLQTLFSEFRRFFRVHRNKRW
jgi:hypothetical protein